MVVKIFLINALADGLFSGGKAGVVILRHLGQEVFLQALATELGLPVTAYVLPYNEAYMVRYFTPRQEVETADYAALAAAQALFGAGLAPVTRPVTLLGRGGRRLVTCDPLEKGRLALRLDRAPLGRPAAVVAERLAAGLGLAQEEVAGIFTGGESNLVLCCKEAESLHRVAYSGRTVTVPKPYASLMVSAPLGSAGDEAGYAVRCFNAEGELVEVPVDLSPHAGLAVFWAEKLARQQLTVHHLASRTCLFRVDLSDQSHLTVSGSLNTILKADPVLSELTADLPPELAAF